MTDPSAAIFGEEPQRSLPPVAHRNYWIGIGLLIQLIGAGIPTAVLFNRAKHEDLLDHVTGLTVKLVWHQAIHDHHDRLLIIVGAVIYAAGSIVLARPFVSSIPLLVVAVPLAALAFVVVLGLLAVVLALIWVLIDAPDISFGGGGGSRRKKKNPASDPGAAGPPPG